MYTLNTITNTVEFSRYYRTDDINLKIGKSVYNTINALYAAGRRAITANDVQYIINRQIAADGLHISIAQVERVLRTLVRDYAAGYRRRELRKAIRVTADEYGFYHL